MRRERFRIEAMQAAYEAGVQARLTGVINRINGWGYPKGKYYAWFVMGYDGRRFIDFGDEYALRKARRLIAAEFRKAGQEANAKQYDNKPGFITGPLLAFARYIAERE
jgi:hypothetical protein